MSRSLVLPIIVLSGIGLLVATRAQAKPSSKVEAILRAHQAIATTSPRPEMSVYDVLKAPGELSAWFVVEGARRAGFAVVVPAHFFEGVVERPGVPNRIFVMPPPMVQEATKNGLYREVL